MKCLSKIFMTISLMIIIGCNPVETQKRSSDNGDGTFTNPVIFADFPDPDVIRVDDVYYMVSTTMFIFPGVTILKSYDLVNWEYCANAVPRMDFSPCYNLDGCNRYSHGQWATSLKYNNGNFYLLFITLDEGGFLCTAPKAEGPWEIRKLPKGFYDPGLFFDEDGRIYVAHGYTNIYITELNPDFSPKTSDSLVFKGEIKPGLEGSHVYKINGYYYLYSTYGGWDSFQVALRSKSIYGPYEEKIVIYDNHIHQGALIELPGGEWWTLLFQDLGAFGRVPVLEPVTWEEGWPMVGVDGKGVITYKKPDVGKEYPATELPTSDEFDSPALGMQWGWNHNPDDEKWSLSERPGYLRLSTVKSVSLLPEARNTLTQRIFGYYSDSLNSTATIKMDTREMKNGDIAGLAIFQDPYSYIGVKMVEGEKYAIMVNDGETIDSVKCKKPVIYLKALAGYGSNKASFQYSYKNKDYTLLGNQMEMQFKLTVFTGNKFCIFNYSTESTGGYVDIDWFRTGCEPL